LSMNNNSSSSISREAPVNTAVDFILSHSEPPLFPRTIMTAATKVQVTVYSKEEILAYFKAANYKDCRISAFRKYVSYDGVNRQPTDFIFADLDLKDFKGDIQKIDKAKDKALKKICKTFGDDVRPTVLWTGGGYHIYLPLSGGIVPEEYDIFAEFAQWWKTFKFKDMTSVFLGFAERYLTDGKCDPQHTPTIKSCLLRVPYTINTKYNEEVKLILKWDSANSSDTTKPNVRYVLREFRNYLCDNRVRVKEEELKQRSKRNNNKKKKNSHSDKFNFSKAKTSDRYTTATTTTTITTTPWIECLLQIGIDDYRKRATSLILAPYLLHKKRLTYEESAQVIRNWLVDKCQSQRKLDFNPERKIKEALSYSQQNKILHMRFDTLKNSNPELYNQLLERMGKRVIVH
jgi:hypothetical protein